MTSKELKQNSHFCQLFIELSNLSIDIFLKKFVQIIFSIINQKISLKFRYNFGKNGALKKI